MRPTLSWDFDLAAWPDKLQQVAHAEDCIQHVIGPGLRVPQLTYSGQMLAADVVVQSTLMVIMLHCCQTQHRCLLADGGGAEHTAGNRAAQLTCSGQIAGRDAETVHWAE